MDSAAAGLPDTLTAAQIADLNGGRLPVGVRSQDQAFDVTYTDTLIPTVSTDSGTGVVLGVELRLVRTAQVSVPTRGPVAAGTVVELTATAAAVGTAGAAQVAEIADRQVSHQVLGQVIPGLLVIFALVLLAFGLPKLFGNQPPPPPPRGERGPADPVRAAAPGGTPAGRLATTGSAITGSPATASATTSRTAPAR